MNITSYTNKNDLNAAIYNLGFGETLYVENVPNEVYHTVKGWSSSHGKIAGQSEQRLHRYLTKKDDGPKAHYVFGELTHDSIRLTPDEIDNIYCGNVQLARAGSKLGDAQRECISTGKQLSDVAFEFESETNAASKIAKKENPGKVLLLPDQYAAGLAAITAVAGRTLTSNVAVSEARELADLIRMQHTVASLLSKYDPIFELSVFRKDHDGFVRKCRPDCYFPAVKIVLDWKTTRDIVWTFETGDRHTFVKRSLNREIDRRDYGLSAAWYMDILGIIEDGAFMLVFADKDAMEVYPPVAFSVERLLQERNRCIEASQVIKSMQGKFIDGELAEPLTTFLPNDDHVFSGNTKEFL